MQVVKTPKKSLSLKQWLSIVLALSIVGAVLFVGDRSFEATKKAAFDEFNRRQLVMAKEAASAIQFYFMSIAGTLQSMAGVQQVTELDEQATRQELEHVFIELKRLGANDIGVLDANGTVKYTMVAPHIEGADFSWRRYFKRAKATQSSDDYFIEFIDFKGVDVGLKGVLVAVPIFKIAANDRQGLERVFMGVLVCTTKLDVVTQRFVAPVKPSAKGHAFLIDGESNLLWTHDKALFGKRLNESKEGSESFRNLLVDMQAGYEGTSEYDGFALNVRSSLKPGGDWLIAHAPLVVGDQSWTVGVTAPKADARAQLSSVYRSHLLSVGLSIVIIMIGASYIIIMSMRAGRSLQREVDNKTQDLIAAQYQVNRLQKKFLERIIASQEEERQRISRELHDDLGQELAALLLEIQSGKAGPESYEKCSESIYKQVRTLIEKVNHIAWNLRPTILDDYGLSSALRLHITKTSEIAGVQVDYKIIPPRESGQRLPSVVEVTLYRIAQEALKNAIQHGSPTQVSVLLVLKPDEVAILVEDDGAGFAVDTVTSSYGDHGLGLIGMRERVALLNGTIAIESEIGHGTTIRVAIPRS